MASLLRAAFVGEVEATIVAALRAECAVLAELVAIEAGVVAGHVVASAASLAGRPVAALAPLAVLPGLQRRGIGSALVRAVLARCRDAGVDAVLVLGEPAYYGRFGFSAAAAAAVTGLPWSGHPAFQALVLRPGASLRGAMRYAHAFGLGEQQDGPE